VLHGLATIEKFRFFNSSHKQIRGSNFFKHLFFIRFQTSYTIAHKEMNFWVDKMVQPAKSSRKSAK